MPQKRIQSKAEAAFREAFRSHSKARAQTWATRRASSVVVIGSTPGSVSLTWVVFKASHGLRQPES